MDPGTVSAIAAPASGPGLVRDLRLVARQLRYEQLAFWRNRTGALFTVGFSVIFLLLLSASGANQRSNVIGNLKIVQYYTPGFAAYGVMSACYNNLGIVLVVRRETGLLKRLRLSPIPTWVLFGAILASNAVIALVQVALLLLIGRFAFGVVLPDQWAALLLALLVGVVCFSALGVAISTVVPSQDSAGPIISLSFFVLLFLSGLWFPLKAGSSLAKISNYFPVHHLIVAFFAPFESKLGASPWAWGDLGTVAIWGAIATIIAVRRFAWEPRRH
ncbi:MAG: transporter [Acidimicrobiaceae bacterium]|nr:transporter [Acidimicrobiaceae bacterium]